MDNKLKNSAHVIEQISAYLDEALGDAVSDAVRVHIDSCAVCHAEYVEVRATRSLLKRVPDVSPPRAFTLTPEMVGRKVSLWQRLLVPRNVPRLATGSALAFALMAFLLVGDLASMGSPRNMVTVSESSYAQKMEPVSPASGGAVAIASTEVSNDAARTGSPPNGLMQSTPMMEATAMADSAFMPQATPYLMVQSPGSYKVPTQAEPLRTEMEKSPPLAETPVTAQLGVSPTEQVLRLAVEAQPTIDSRVSQSTTQAAPDGGRILFLSLEGLLVAIGGLFAVGAIFAARR